MRRDDADRKREELLKAARALQHFIGTNPHEERVSPQDRAERYMPHLYLARTFFLLGNCEAAEREISISMNDGLGAKFKDESEIIEAELKQGDGCRMPGLSAPLPAAPRATAGE
jgi:hypothetical protein